MKLREIIFKKRDLNASVVQIIQISFLDSFLMS